MPLRMAASSMNHEMAVETPANVSSDSAIEFEMAFCAPSRRASSPTRQR
jgi:hypothetical protein